MPSSDAAPHEAILYERGADNRVRCALCHHRCSIADGRRGLCGVRENRAGTLHSLVYGKVIARHVDPIEKKPLFHFLPGTRSYSIATVGCNFRCGFCQNWQISQVPGQRADIPGEPATPEALVADARRTGCATIAYTYTEPTIAMEFALDAAEEAHRHGIRNVFVTNGYQSPEALERMRGLVDAANVDLKAFTDDFYRTQCGARLEPVLDTIRAMHEMGMHVEVTTLVVPGLNDSPEELARIAEFLAGVSPDLAWHVSRFHPDYQATDLPATPVETIELAIRAGAEAGLHYVFAGNLPGRGHEDTVCPVCDKVVIGRRGFTITQRHLDGNRCTFCGVKLPIVVS